MSSKEGAAREERKFIYKLDRLIEKFEHSLEKKTVVKISTIHTLLLSKRESYYILEALKIFREDLVNAVA